ncbi:MAG: class I SAM-dependent methyltransferase, partial [bacterium]|nr:class I SAM-dependent methyltransferase [bacterium]
MTRNRPQPPDRSELVQAFGEVAATYETSRPDYPPAAVAHILDTLTLGPGSEAVDLAAGTGQLTRLLVPSGARVMAVEPVAGMRQELQRVVPGVAVLDGTAEAMPFDDGSLDAVTVGQAFHWFDPEPALAEIDRVLRPGGGLALIWNTRNEDEWPWTEINDLLERWRGDAPRHTHDRGRWQAAFRASRRYEPFEERRYP